LLVPVPLLVAVLEPVDPAAPVAPGLVPIVPELLVLLLPGLLLSLEVVVGAVVAVVFVVVVVVVVVPMVPVELVPLVAGLPVGLVPAELEPVPEVCAAAANAAATSRLKNREKSLRCMEHLLSSFGTVSRRKLYERLPLQCCEMDCW
jgi:hypothetical protein